MNPKRIEAYHHLIKKLLAYPDQAGKILDTQPTLVDARFLQVMQQVSNQVKLKGFPEKAYFLSSLVAQLQDELMPIVNKKPEKRSPQIDESSKRGKFSFGRSGNHQFRKSKENESSVDWNNEWQKFNLKAKKISSRDNRENHHQREGKEISGGSKWISLLILTVFLILSGGVFWYRVSGNRLLGNDGEINYTSSIQTIIKYFLNKDKHKPLF
jgi:hypothetical protein